mgnify:CR=1 FL=1
MCAELGSEAHRHRVLQAGVLRFLRRRLRSAGDLGLASVHRHLPIEGCDDCRIDPWQTVDALDIVQILNFEC